MSDPLPTRTVELVVVDGRGELRGRLPTFTVATPWWQDLEPVLAARPDVVLLRLLSAESAPGHVMGGRVRYLAEASSPPSDLLAIAGAEPDLADHPLRMPWARPGGPAADLAWAETVVTSAGPPQQVRSWNLSSIWRLPTADGPVWLKCVPPFFAHEPTVLRALAGSGRVPSLLAADGHRMLLADLPGRDGYDATDAERRAIADVLVALQADTATRLGELPGAVPDWRRAPLRAMVAAVVARHRPHSERLAALVEGWDDRFDAVDACGLPDVLFHGDAHPGNARIGVEPPIIFDWGDSGLGHPLLDLAGFADAAGDADLRRHWLDRWAAAAPPSDPGRAWALLQPIAVVRGAVVFQRFLDNIEPSERVYHAGDVEPFLDAAERLLPA